jgi:hypothetical protein
MTTTLAEVDSGSSMTTEDAHHTNVYVLLDYVKPSEKPQFLNAVYGPFRSFNAAKDWGLINSTNFSIMEISRPIGVEAIGFVDTTPAEPTLEDQGIHPDHAQIGDYIDPNVAQ